MRILHTMIRVTNLEQSLKFYTHVLGMKLLRQEEYSTGRFTLAFIGYQEEASHTVIELTYNWDTHHYELGNGFGHIAIEVENIMQTCDDIKLKGGKVTREPGPMNHSSTIIAFIEDPDGYKIELIEKKTAI